MSPKEFFEQMQDENTVVLDARNDYEYEIGHFRGAVKPDITNFRDLPDWVRENKQMFEGKKSLRIAQVESAARNSPVGLSKKALRMLVSFTAASQPTGRTRKFKATFGMVKCMYSMKELLFRSIKKNMSLSVAIFSLANHVNAMSIALTLSATKNPLQ